MSNRLKDTLDRIAPSAGQKARMLSNIEREADRQAQITAPDRRSGMKWLKVAAVAAALCCVFVMTAFAEEIGSLFDGLFVKDEIVAQTVLTGVYTDNDGHVNMAVEELLSDGIAARVVVRYQALDQQGKDWLDSLSNPSDTLDPNVFFGLNIRPAFKDWNTFEYGVNWSYGAYELEDLRTETERCFVATMGSDRSGWGTNDVEFTYGMTDGKKNTLLNISTDIEKKVIDLDAPEDSDKLYTPLKATITPLSFVIEGEEDGIIDSRIEQGANGENYYYQSVVNEEEIDNLYLHLTDGSWINLLAPSEYNLYGEQYGDAVKPGTVIHDGAWLLCAGNNSSGENSFIIAGTHFMNPIDISSVAGFKLDGVYYEFN